MKFLISGRGLGKTMKLMADAIQYATKHPTCVITHSEKEAERIRALYRKELIGSKLEVFGYRRLLMNPKKRFKRVLVDNLDIILADLFFEHFDQRGEERPQLTLATATGAPIRDLYAVRETAAAIWEIAAKDAKTTASRGELIDSFERKAKELLAAIPEWYRISKELENGQVQDNKQGSPEAGGSQGEGGVVVKLDGERPHPVGDAERESADGDGCDLE